MGKEMRKRISSGCSFGRSQGDDGWNILFMIESKRQFLVFLNCSSLELLAISPNRWYHLMYSQPCLSLTLVCPLNSDISPLHSNHSNTAYMEFLRYFVFAFVPELMF